MEVNDRRVLILMVDDDEDDYVLIRDALRESELDHDLRLARDGLEAMEYLRSISEPKGEKDAEALRPDLILLDLNMPEMDGRAVLRALKENPEFRAIPVVVLTESLSEADAIYCYRLGVESYFTKAAWLHGLADVIKASAQYWFNLMTGKLRMGKSR